MQAFDPTAYGPTFGPLLDTDRNRALDRGHPNSRVWSQLSGLTAAAAFEPATIADSNMASAAVAGVWLLHDHLDDSHRLSQGIPTGTGSFWHGIMHRREGDYSNAKYWFRNAGDHPIQGRLAAVALELATPHRANNVLPADGWDAMAFVDACQAAVRGQSGHEAYCRAVQQAEWELLFDHCYQRALS